MSRCAEQQVVQQQRRAITTARQSAADPPPRQRIRAVLADHLPRQDEHAAGECRDLVDAVKLGPQDSAIDLQLAPAVCRQGRRRRPVPIQSPPG